MKASPWFTSRQYLALCAAILVLPYVLVLFTDAGNFFHGGGPFDKVLLDASVVLGAAASAELVRVSDIKPIRLIAFAVGIPLFVFAAILVYFAITYHLVGALADYERTGR